MLGQVHLFLILYNTDQPIVNYVSCESLKRQFKDGKWPKLISRSVNPVSKALRALKK